MSIGELPPYLHRTDPMELDDLPLQVALLTGELQAHHHYIAKLELEIEFLKSGLEELMIE